MVNHLDLGYNFQMLSDGQSLIFLEPNKDVTIIADEFFVSSLSVSSEPQIIEVTSMRDNYRQAIFGGIRDTRLSFELVINGPMQYKQGGIIRSIFDLYSIRELLTQVEQKVNRRG